MVSMGLSLWLLGLGLVELRNRGSSE